MAGNTQETCPDWNGYKSSLPRKNTHLLADPCSSQTRALASIGIYIYIYLYFELFEMSTDSNDPQRGQGKDQQGTHPYPKEVRYFLFMMIYFIGLMRSSEG